MKKPPYFKILIFSSIPLIIFLCIAEILCRVKLFAEKNDTYYLTAPFFRKELKGDTVVEYELHVRHFNKDNRSLNSGSWHAGPNWYYKIEPGVYAAPSPYNYGNYRINSLGFRGKEFNPFEKSGKIRIFCIGESTTFGAESSDDYTFPARLEYYLNRLQPGKFEVINSGFSGYSSLNYLNLILFELIKYKPDIFIIYSGINDLNIYRNFEKNKINKFVEVIHNALYYKLSMFYTLLLEKISVSLQNSPMPLFLYSNKDIKIYKENIKKIIQISKNSGIKIIFVRQLLNVPKDLEMQDNLSLDEIKAVFKKTEDQLGVDKYVPPLLIYRFNKLAGALKKICLENNINILDLRGKFYSTASDNKELFYDYIHLTPKGNDKLGELTSAYIYDGQKKESN